MIPTETGIYTDVTWDEYKSIDRMNASTIVHGCHSMRRLKRIIDSGGGKSTKPQEFGVLYHSILLDSVYEFEDRYCIMPPFENDPLNVTKDGEKPKSPTSTGWYKERVKEFMKTTKKKVVPEKDYRFGMRMIDAIRSHHYASKLVASGHREVTLLGEIDGVLFKGRVDILNDSINDLKGCNSATIKTFGNWCARLHYPFKLSIYRELVRQTLGKLLPVKIIAAETKDDFDVVVYPVEAPVLDEAFGQVRKVVSEYKRCLEADFWPGIDKGEDMVDLYVPVWSMPDVDDVLDWEGVE